MTLIGEVAVTPQVFFRSCYASEDQARQAMKLLSMRLLSDSLARDLGDGQWLGFLQNADAAEMHPKAKELFRKLREQNRLTRVVKAMAAGIADETSEEAWVAEALAADARDHCDGTVVSPTYGRTGAPLSRADELLDAAWWDELQKSTSVRIARSLPSYLESFGAVLRGARSVIFIDPHADPQEARYDSLLELISSCQRSAAPPLIELHRVRHRRAGRQMDLSVDWRAAFASWDQRLRASGVRLRVHIRSDFHDRYVVTDQIGIGLSNGLDLSRRSEKLQLSRLSRADTDGVRADFSRNSGNPKLADEFEIGGSLS